MNKNTKRIVWIIAIIILLVIAIVVNLDKQNSGSDSGAGNNQGVGGEVQNFETSDDVFNEIDSTVEFLE